METKLPNKRVFITGASRGIGRAIAERLASEGYHLVLVSSQAEGLQQLQADLEARYRAQEFLICTADLSLPAEIKRVCEFAERLQPEVLVNNVGIFRPISLLDEGEGEYLPQFYVNYFAAHELCKVLGRQMKAKGAGYIFNISSTASREPVQAGTYSVTKFAMRGLSAVLREELRHSGVKVTEIIPGSTWTSSWAGSGHASERFVRATEIADVLSMCLKMSETTLLEEVVVKPQRGNILTEC